MRRLSRTILVLALFVSLLVGSTSSAVRIPWLKSRPVDRPNIVWILTDDMAYGELRHLPHVRQLLVDQGVTFTNASAGNALCCPARATLLTGQYSHNNRVMSNGAGDQGGWKFLRRHNDVETMVPDWMRRAGYRTWHAGKYMNHYESRAKQPDWDFFYSPLRDAYDPRNWTASLNGRLKDYRSSYQQRVMDRLIRRTLQRWSDAEQDRPFFLYTQSLAPHHMTTGSKDWRAPVPERRYRGTVDRRQFGPSPAFNERDLRDKPAWARDLSKVKRYPRKLRARRIESLRSVDDTVATIARQLRRTGEYDDTVFVFTSDNGFLFGEHRLRGKNLPYEQAQRIPLVMAGPGFTPGIRVRRQVSLVDVVATTVELANAAPDDRLDGVSLLAYDDEGEVGRDRPVVIEGGAGVRPRRRAVDEIGRQYSGVRWRHFVYVEYQGGGREFYDLRRDPHQLDNRYRRRDPSPAQAAMRGWLADRGGRDCAGSMCNAPIRLRPSDGRAGR